MKLNSFLFILTFSFPVFAVAHDAPPIETRNTVGLVAGKSIGSGLFYRYALSDVYLQLSGLYSSAQFPIESNIGIASGYYFHEESLLHLRVPIKLHVYFAVNREFFSRETIDSTASDSTLEGMFYTSVGVALDIYHPTHPNFGAMIGTSYGSRAHVRNGEGDYLDLNDGWVSNAFSIFYRW